MYFEQFHYTYIMSLELGQKFFDNLEIGKYRE